MCLEVLQEDVLTHQNMPLDGGHVAKIRDFPPLRGVCHAFELPPSLSPVRLYVVTVTSAAVKVGKVQYTVN